MNYTFTMELHMLKAKSQDLQSLLMALPGDKIRQLFLSPPDELVKRLKKLGHQEIDKI